MYSNILRCGAHYLTEYICYTTLHYTTLHYTTLHTTDYTSLPCTVPSLMVNVRPGRWGGLVAAGCYARVGDMGLGVAQEKKISLPPCCIVPFASHPCRDFGGRSLGLRVSMTGTGVRLDATEPAEARDAKNNTTPPRYLVGQRRGRGPTTPCNDKDAPESRPRHTNVSSPSCRCIPLTGSRPAWDRRRGWRSGV
ncbi:hypothetical protein L209DRAFT_537040 [Thermothelomyces heterothallicus CBS 203.75]